MADDAGVAEQPLDVPLGERRHALDRKAGESGTKVLSLAEDRDPREPRLEAFEREQLEHRVVALLLASPLVVVVGLVQRIVAAPAAARDARIVDREIVHRPILPIGSVRGMFELTVENAPTYLVERGLVPADAALDLEELPGGVSATVIAVRSGAGFAVVVKQALPQLRVADDWLATPDRAETEVAAMRLCGGITPGIVPQVLDSDASAHILVMKLIPPDARNWQAEVGEGRVHAERGRWAGSTLGAWHAATSGSQAPAGLEDFEAFEQLRLRPFHETVIERLPELADGIAPLLAELRSDRRCFVHGDYSMKNMLVGSSGDWVLDFEVAHHGNPVFDLGFFLSFVVLSAIRWPELQPQLGELADGFLDGYGEAAGGRFAGSSTSVTAHTAALMLARTDGKSPALFLDPSSRDRARAAGIALLRTPEGGLWQWL